MADDKKTQGGQDRIRVNGEERYEVDYILEQFPGMSREEITAAIEEAGPMREDIMALLERRKQGK